MYKLVPVEKVEYPPGVTEKSFNELPEPYKEITWHEVQHKLQDALPSYTEYRQVFLPSTINPKPNRMHSTQILWFNDSGVAFVFTSDWHLKNNKIIYEMPPRFFYIGCPHSYEELSQQECRELNIQHYGRCWHVNKCLKCGHIYSCDSSD